MLQQTCFDYIAVFSFQIHNKILIQQSLSECPKSSFYLSHQPLVIIIMHHPTISWLAMWGDKGIFQNVIVFFCLSVWSRHSGTSLPVPDVPAYVKVNLGRAGTGELGLCWLMQPRAYAELLWAKIWAGSTLSSQLAGVWSIISWEKARFAIICNLGYLMLYEKQSLLALSWRPEWVVRSWVIRKCRVRPGRYGYG